MHALALHASRVRRASQQPSFTHILMLTSSLSAPAAVTESASSSRPLMCIDGEQVKLQSRPEQSPTQQQPLPECTVAPQDASAVPSRVECHPGFRLVRNGQSNASAIASSLTFSGSRLVKKDWYFCSESKMRAAATLLVTHHNSTKCPPPPRWESLPRGQVWQHAHDVCLYGDSMMDQFFSALQGKLLASGEIKQRIVEQSYNWTRGLWADSCALPAAHDDGGDDSVHLHEQRRQAKGYLPPGARQPKPAAALWASDRAVRHAAPIQCVHSRGALRDRCKRTCSRNGDLPLQWRLTACGAARPSGRS